MRLQLAKQLLDQQIVDRDGCLVGRVDDIDFGFDADGVPYVDCLLSGQGALGQRIGGPIGSLLVSLAERFAGGAPVPLRRIPLTQVAAVDSVVRLRCRVADLPPPPTETWLRRHVIDRIPGADRAGR